MRDSHSLKTKIHQLETGVSLGSVDQELENGKCRRQTTADYSAAVALVGQKARMVWLLE